MLGNIGPLEKALSDLWNFQVTKSIVELDQKQEKCWDKHSVLIKFIGHFSSQQCTKNIITS